MSSIQLDTSKFVLTTHFKGEDNPIWTYNVGQEIEKRELFFNLGANLVFWKPSQNGNGYYPSTADPVMGSDPIPYDQYPYIVESPQNLIFLAGKRCDILLRRIEDEDTNVVVLQISHITNGSITKLSSLRWNTSTVSKDTTFGSKTMVVYGERFLVFLSEDKLHMCNLHTGSIEKTFHGLPVGGVITTNGQQAIVWSTLQNGKKTVINLEEECPPEKPYIVELCGSEQGVMAHGYKILGFSPGGLVVGDNISVEVFGASGTRIYRKKFDFGESFESMITCHNSIGLAFVTKKGPIRTVVHLREFGTQKNDGKQLPQCAEYYAGGLPAGTMILYEDTVFVNPERVSIVFDDILNLEYTYLEMMTKPQHRTERFFMISPVFGWVLEVNQDEERKESLLVTRIAFNRPISTKPMQKRFWREIERPGIIVPPYLFHSKRGDLRIWIPREEINKQGKAVLVLELYEWDGVKQSMGKLLYCSTQLALPSEKIVAHWSTTPEWIVLAMGPRAYVFEQEGNLASVDVLLKNEDQSIKAAKGFGTGIWFIGGSTQETQKEGIVVFDTYVTEVAYWNGANKVARKTFDQEFLFRESVATGLYTERSQKIAKADLILASKDSKKPWKICTFNAKDNSVDSTTFGSTSLWEKTHLCPTPDYAGRVFFSQGKQVLVYEPGLRDIILKVDFDQSDIYEERAIYPIVVEHDYVRNLFMGEHFLWVFLGTGFFRLPLETLNDNGLTQRELPIIAPRTEDIDELGPQVQIPEIVRRHNTRTQNEEPLVLQNENFVWLSNRPAILYKKPDMSNRSTITITLITDPATMLVLSTLIRDGQSGGSRTVSSDLVEVVL